MRGILAPTLIAAVCAVLPCQTGDADRPDFQTMGIESIRLEHFDPNKPYIVIDTHTNRLYLRTQDRVLLKALCSTGTGAELTDPESGRHWVFNTPRGVFAVNAMAEDPIWQRPDWAFIEEKQPIPENIEDRYDTNMMGDYSIGFGDGYYIHGTIFERLLGVSVTHGCIRVGAEDLAQLYQQVEIGTLVVIL